MKNQTIEGVERMHPEMVRVFFQMLTQLDDVQAYESLILSAVDEVTAALKPDANPKLQPLHLLAAAIAITRRYRQCRTKQLVPMRERYRSRQTVPNRLPPQSSCKTSTGSFAAHGCEMNSFVFAGQKPLERRES